MAKQEVKKVANKATNVMCVRALQSHEYAKLPKSLFYGYLGVCGGGGKTKKTKHPGDGFAHGEARCEPRGGDRSEDRGRVPRWRVSL